MPKFKTTDASDLPRTNAQTNQKPRPKHQQTQQKETAIAKVHVPNKTLKKKGCCLDTKSPVQKSFRVSLLREAKNTTKARRRKALKENAVGKKCKKKQQCAIYRGTGPRKAKRPNKLSLKRHAAWEYPESAARHKSLFWLPHPHSPRGPVRRRDLFKFQKASYFLTRPFFGQNRQVKKGGNVGTPPSGKHVARTSQ